MEPLLIVLAFFTPAFIGGLFARVRMPWYAAPALFAMIALVLLGVVWWPALECYSCGDGDFNNGTWGIIETIGVVLGWIFAVFWSFVGAIFGMLLRRKDDGYRPRAIPMIALGSPG